MCAAATCTDGCGDGGERARGGAEWDEMTTCWRFFPPLGALAKSCAAVGRRGGGSDAGGRKQSERRNDDDNNNEVGGEFALSIAVVHSQRM